MTGADPEADTCRAYMISGQSPEDGAALVFHHTGRRARNLSWREVSWLEEVAGGSIIGVRVKRLKSAHLWEERTTTEPEVIESPRTCPSCEMWGSEPVIITREEDVYCEGVRLYEKGEQFEVCEFCDDDDRGDSS